MLEIGIKETHMLWLNINFLSNIKNEVRQFSLKKEN